MKTDKLSRFANYGIEDMDETTTVSEVEEVAEVPVEQAEAEVEVAETEVAEVEGDVEEMEDVAESLEAICLGIEMTLATGGLNKQAAAFALQSTDLQLARLGLNGIKVGVEEFIEAPAKPVGEDPIAEASAISAGEPGKPVGTDNQTSVEPDAASVAKSEEAGTAGSDNTDAVVTDNVAVSQEAVANIREIIKKIMESIANALKAFYEKVKEFFDKAKLMIGNVGREAAELAKKAASAPGKFYKRQKLKSRLGKAMGKEEVRMLLKFLDETSSLTDKAVTETTAELQKAFDLVLGDDEEGQKQGLAMIDEAASKLVTAVGTVAATASNEESSETEVDAVSAAQAEDVAKEAADVAKKTLASKAKDKADAALNKLKSVCESFLKKVSDLGDKASASAKSAAGKIGGLLGKATKAVADAFRTAYTKTAKGLKDATDYVKMQLANLTDKEGGEEEPAKAE